MKRIIIGILVVFMCLSPVSAAGDMWSFSFIGDMIDSIREKGMEVSQTRISPGISDPEDKYKALDRRVDGMATDDNLETINAMMHRYRYTAIHINVVDESGIVQRNYYIVRDGGVKRDYTGNADLTVTINEEDADRMLDMVEDGNLSFSDQVAMSQIINGSPYSLEYMKLCMVRLAYGS